MVGMVGYSFTASREGGRRKGALVEGYLYEVVFVKYVI